MVGSDESPLLENNLSRKGKPSKSRSALVSHSSVSLLGALFVLAIFQFQMDGFKGILVDIQFRLHFWKSPHPAIALIAYDDASFPRYGESNKIPSEEIVKVFERLAEEKPKAVALIAPLNEKLYSNAELTAIAQSFNKVPNTLVGYIDDESLARSAPTQIAGVATYLPGFISRDNFSYGADSVSRRVMITIDAIPTVYSELARIYRGLDTLPSFRHTHGYGETGNSLQTYIHWQGPPGTYRIHPSELVVKQKLPSGIFTDKIVFFGSRLETRRVADFVLTPYSRNPTRTPLLEGAAHGLVTLLEDNAVFRSPAWFNAFLSLLIAIVTVNMVLFLSPGRGILFVISEIGVLFVTAWLGLVLLHCWVDLAHPFVVACFGYYLVIPYRLVDEYRKRWHYQEKSEMMTQLEQLKTNFLSLISHDLKTPIARIQGNAELLMNESQEIGEKAKKYLAAIVHTTEDLGHYVETILDLTRIESAGVPLQKTSKDINASILEVVDSRRFLAAEKNITLTTDLEPMFSFKFDPKLIKRVLGNLLENAIKYSGENRKIILTSREEVNWIRITVQDEGIGIPFEEHDKIFTKFYRCDNDFTKKNNGTGLGLYLVKYFVELHRGMVDLKSEVGRGSTFTISLPV